MCVWRRISNMGIFLAGSGKLKKAKDIHGYDVILTTYQVRDLVLLCNTRGVEMQTQIRRWRRNGQTSRLRKELRRKRRRKSSRIISLRPTRKQRTGRSQRGKRRGKVCLVLRTTYAELALIAISAGLLFQIDVSPWYLARNESAVL
jgi:hypothetical protein